LNNKLDRLSGRGSYKKYGPKFSEISDHLHEVEVKFERGRLSGVLSTKVWGRYASGKYTPSRILDVLDVFYPGTKIEFEDGPFKVFKIMHCNFMLEAVGIFIQEFVGYLCPKGKELTEGKLGSIQEFLIHHSNEWNNDNNFEDVVNKLKKFDNILKSLRGDVYEEDFLEYGHSAYLNTLDQLVPSHVLACFYLSLGFIQYKFLGDYRLLMYSVCRMDVLTEVELAYKIPRELWFNEKTNVSDDISNVFTRLKSMENFSLPDESTPIFRTFPKLIKSNTNLQRFSGRKMT
jgi:hypothetical protein